MTAIVRRMSTLMVKSRGEDKKFMKKAKMEMTAGEKVKNLES